ncbi:ribosomal RNA small subunit methyltransferase A [bacterium]|jgi:16S rRNA (adenine1518-N6/adenine1519-N6)-dimethyltransferase|nr:ribosomal RNA small subunit methyltransferase A [bacterium]MBT5014924.1 ribosomal RNA small subunit methyltransferase A [bacterium]
MATIKKQYGQHFLRDSSYLQTVFDSVHLSPESSVFEIGGGDGFLTRAILDFDIKRLWVFEIDEEWAVELRKIQDDRLTVLLENILDADLSKMEQDKPWTLIANLPYNITFPILRLLHAHRGMLTEGVIMIQEEVAQKILASRGRGYGYVSLFFQWYFDWKQLDKVPPTAFYPPPKVFSRFLYFKPKKDLPKISDEEKFWRFIKVCFKQPRRTLNNNLSGTHYLSHLSSDQLKLRAQQLTMQELLELWNKINS